MKFVRFKLQVNVHAVQIGTSVASQVEEALLFALLGFPLYGQEFAFVVGG